ncbi:MAG TPA: hypothetical protein VGC05_03720 [Mycobacterium sp.]
MAFAVVEDEEGLLWLLPPQETTNIPAAATASAADSCRMAGAFLLE